MSLIKPNIAIESDTEKMPDCNLVLQIDGDYWHCNPNSYAASYYHSKRDTTANEIWKNDADNTKQISEAGYTVKRIWGSELTEDSILKSIRRRL